MPRLGRLPPGDLDGFLDEPIVAGVEVRGVATLSSGGFGDVVRRTAELYFGESQGAAHATTVTTPGTVIRIEPGTFRACDYADEV
jgi:hypothetical protein